MAPAGMKGEVPGAILDEGDPVDLLLLSVTDEGVASLWLVPLPGALEAGKLKALFSPLFAALLASKTKPPLPLPPASEDDDGAEKAEADASGLKLDPAKVKLAGGAGGAGLDVDVDEPAAV